MKRGWCISCASLALLSTLLGCRAGDRGRETEGDGQRSAPSRPSFVARGIRYGAAAEGGQRREIEVDTVAPLPGRISGLRVPLLDGLVLDGVRIRADGVVVRRISRLEIDPFRVTLARRGSAAVQPELAGLAEALANVVGRRPDGRPAPP